ncbi:MAG: SIS domain-containing protein [Lachnospiraceae bacterium]|nr:SIS domain-containing protein [Lachnospiraceae bacterium]
MSNLDIIRQRINDSIEAKTNLLADTATLEVVSQLADLITDCIKKGGKLVICGNGGSASDALHFAGEIVGRFVKERKAWPAVVLNADVATMTAIANDYGYDDVFARQAEGHVKPGDVFIGISTSGNSENVFRAVLKAKELGTKTAALLGKDGGKIAKEVDYPIIVHCNTTARVQECHINIIHILCEISEAKLSAK